MATDIHAANAVLQQPLDLNINRFAAPFHGPTAHADTRSPGMLAADLKAQQDLFSRLRFAYTKQVEKERTLDYLVNQAVPQTISDGELQDLEQETAGLKTNLKERKVRVAEVLSDLEHLARDVGQREFFWIKVTILAEDGEADRRQATRRYRRISSFWRNTHNEWPHWKHELKNCELQSHPRQTTRI